MAADHPEFYIFSPWGGTDPFFDRCLAVLVSGPGLCHRESTWLTNLKGLATYNIPKLDVLISGTFQSLPYAGNDFPFVQSQSLGDRRRRCSSVPVDSPWTAARGRHSRRIPQPCQARRTYGDRLNAVDLRFGKILKYGKTRTLVDSTSST